MQRDIAVFGFEKLGSFKQHELNILKVVSDNIISFTPEHPVVKITVCFCNLIHCGEVQHCASLNVLPW